MNFLLFVSCQNYCQQKTTILNQFFIKNWTYWTAVKTAVNEKQNFHACSFFQFGIFFFNFHGIWYRCGRLYRENELIFCLNFNGKLICLHNCYWIVIVLNLLYKSSLSFEMNTIWKEKQLKNFDRKIDILIFCKT